jgi:tetratricopeptide (TPR) repeat protein/predicted Ser/Thr protein kinase
MPDNLQQPLDPRLDQQSIESGESASGIAIPFVASLGTQPYSPTEQPPLPAQPPRVPVFPGYEVRGELGCGGMGMVYLGRHLALNRLVALKVLHADRTTDRHLARFRTEAEAIARVQHPNIVAIYEVGEYQGEPFFAMEYVEGGTLRQRRADRPLSAIEAARMTATLARAIHHAHQRGILHRDLKPANILLAADGTPRITDFGLAKQLDAPDGPTRAGDIMGTPSYMAPEQAEGRPGDIATATDVYALGAILYELLTGRPPFRADSTAATLRQVIHDPPVRPSTLHRKLPHDLETICLKCLEKSPKDRYGSAEGLAEDLERFLDDRPIRARRSAPWERAVKWVRRRPMAASLLFVSLLALVIGALAWQGHRRSTALAAARQADEDYMAFQRLRDAAVFLGMNALADNLLLTGMDAAASRKAARQSARQALALAGVVLEGESAPPRLGAEDPARRGEVAEGCYTLLLLLAASLPDAEALDIVERAARVHRATAAYRLRRDHYRHRLGLPPEDASTTPLPVGAMDHFLIGYHLHQQGHREEALRSFEKAVIAQPDHFWAHLHVGMLALETRQWEVARAHLTVCLAKHPDYVWPYLLHGYACGEAASWDAAEDSYAAAARLLDTQANAEARYALLNNRGLLRIHTNHLDEAATDLHEATVLNPELPAAWINLARVYINQQRWPEAQSAMQVAVRHGWNKAGLADVYANQAEALLDNRTRAAAGAACRLVGGGPFTPLTAAALARPFLGAHLCDERAVPQAIAACRAALGKVPTHPRANGVLAQALFEQRDYAGSLRAWDAYLEFGGGANAEVYRLRGHAHLRLRHHLMARDDFTRGLALVPADADMHLGRGWAYYFGGAYLFALEDFQSAVLSPAHAAEAHSGSGLCRVEGPEWREAIKDAEQARLCPPVSAITIYNIACIYARAVDRIEADASAADRSTLADRWRQEAARQLRRSIDLLPEADRADFWHATVVPDKALTSIRGTPEFVELSRRFPAKKN